MQIINEKTTLRDETRELLRNRPLTVTTKDVAKFLGVSCQWVNQFARGLIPNPGVNTIETLNAFLKQEIKKVNKNVR
jgi:transcriptional regulator with XRE-family HTH domain